MGMSTQRLLVIVLAINLLFSFAFAINQAPTTFDSEVFGELVEIGEDSGTRFETEGGNTVSTNLQEEGSFGRALLMGATIFGLLIKGMVWVPFEEGLGGGLTGIAITALILFRVFMIVLIGMEVYMLLKNRKNS